MGEGDKRQDRDERLRAALRANLRRRKAQVRGREAQEGEPEEAEPAPAPEDKR